MRLLSLFSGIGAFEKALDRLDIDYELVNYCEIDPYASKAYSLIHGVPESKNLGDITTVDTSKLHDIDMITYGFPCVDISLAGRMRGFEHEGEQTRSGLFYEAMRIIEDTRPKYAICENVKNLVSKRFKEEFEIVLSSLERAGYNNYWKVLNAKDFGIPQNRERVFIISIRNDIDDGKFQFPQPQTLELRLRDLLEGDVDEKYYMSDKSISYICATGTNDGKPVTNNSLEPVRLGNIYGEHIGTGYAGNVWDKDSICPTLMTMQGGNRQPMVIEEPRIQRVDIPQTVKVRKYPIDNEALCNLLREHKALTNITNNEIARTLNVPITKVEHWFRQDQYFAIPDDEIWFNLKNLLGIDTDEFDESIMTFEEKEGVYEKSERHYLSDGIAPTLTSLSGNEKIIVRENNKRGFTEAYEGDTINFEQPNSKTRRGRVGRGVAQTINTGTLQGVVVGEPFIVASRGRYVDGSKTEQRLEPNFRGVSNTLTTVQKDNLVCEPKIQVIGNYMPSGHDASRIVHGDGLAPTVKENHGTVTAVLDEPKLRIRKLTPKECFRLMGFDDRDIDILVENKISNTQLYKMAGNSIVVDVLEAIFEMLTEEV